MKKGLLGVLVAGIAFGGIIAAEPPPREETLAMMEKVADWQLLNPSRHHPLEWTQGAYYAGLMALSDLSLNSKYSDALLAVGEKHAWGLRSVSDHADDHAVGQLYCELYRIYDDPNMLLALKNCFDLVIAKKRSGLIYWWCDALFMAPPALARLTAVTGDMKYLDFAVAEWKKTSERLYNETDHLYFRDSRFFPDKKTEKNGKNIYWSRGNGWVLGGLARLLQVMPMNHPERPWFERQFKEIAAAVIAIQPEDGAWRASLLDTENHTMPEASGTGFFTYGLSWGYNQGLLGEDAKTAALKGWQALCSFVKDDGKLTHVQAIAADPAAALRPDSTEVYGVGAFLAAGSEICRMALLKQVKHHTLTITCNEKDFKGRAIIALGGDNLESIKQLPGFSKGTYAVMDGASARWIPTQFVSLNGHDILLILTEMLPGGDYTFTVFPEIDGAQIPQPAVRTFARFVPERLDDFAFENDRAVFRIYGPALEKTDGLSKMGSGVDAWGKAVRTPVIDRMYASGKYHNAELGYGIDAYKVGTGPGCGGAVPWVNGKPLNLGAFKTWEILDNGPIVSRMLFTYASADGAIKAETGYITWLGSDGFFTETTFTAADPETEIMPSLGLSVMDFESITLKKDAVFCVQPGDGVEGMAFGTCAFVSHAGEPVRHGDACYLMGKPGKGKVTVEGFAGSAWSRGIDYPELKGWGGSPAFTGMFSGNVSVRVK